MKKEYHAAEFARLAGVNKKTLLYYDEIGLFRPMRVEPNGYRVYGDFQLDHLALIALLRDLGVSLKEIRAYLTNSDPAGLDAMLTQQSEELTRRIELLRRRSAMLESLRLQNREYLLYCGKGPQLLRRPAERLAILMEAAAIKQGTVTVNYLTDGLNTGLCMRGEERFLYQRRADGNIVLPAGDYVCLYEDLGAQEPSLLQQWAAERRPVLERWAEQQHLALENTLFVETNELAPGEGKNSNAPQRTVRIPVRTELASVSPENQKK